MEKGDDLETAMAKLIDQAAKCSIQRFHCAIELKVKLLSVQVFCSFSVVIMGDLFCIFMSKLSNDCSLVKNTCYG